MFNSHCGLSQRHQGGGAVSGPLQSGVAGLVAEQDAMSWRGHYFSISLQGSTSAKCQVQLSLDVAGAVSALNVHRVVVGSLPIGQLHFAVVVVTDRDYICCFSVVCCQRSIGQRELGQITASQFSQLSVAIHSPFWSFDW